MTKKVGRFLLALVAALVVGIAAGGGIEQSGAASETPTSTVPQAPPSLATVEQRDLIDTFETDGTLTYGDPKAIHVTAEGYISELPEVDDVPSFDAPVFLIDDEPVFLMQGDLPQYRDFKPSMKDGPDVLQLEESLSKMTFIDNSNITVDEDYTSATQDAMDRLYEHYGYEAPDDFPIGTILFVPEPFRVDELDVDRGQLFNGGAVFGATSPNYKVVVNVDSKRLQYFTEGVEATVELPSGEKVLGVVKGGTREVQGSFNSANSNESDVTIEVEIELKESVDDQYPEGAPVAVSVTKDEFKDVTVVPVNALVAVAGGGFAVDVWNGSSGDLVAVEIGADVDGLVAITGEIEAGQQVVVP